MSEEKKKKKTINMQFLFTTETLGKTSILQPTTAPKRTEYQKSKLKNLGAWSDSSNAEIPTKNNDQ